MRKVALVAAAGWKGAGSKAPEDVLQTLPISSPLAGCPECLLPLGDGTVFISRLVAQLKSLGFSLVISAGRPGCLFPGTAHHHYDGGHPKITKEALKLGETISPWTDERIDFLRYFGNVVLVDNPDIGSCHDSYCQLIDAAGSDWDRWLLVPADSAFTMVLLEELLAEEPPCWFELADAVLWLDKIGVNAYRREAQKHIGSGNHNEGMRFKARFKKSARQGIGIRFVEQDQVKYGTHQREVDFPAMYANVLRWATSG